MYVRGRFQSRLQVFLGNNPTDRRATSQWVGHIFSVFWVDGGLGDFSLSHWGGGLLFSAFLLSFFLFLSFFLCSGTTRELVFYFCGWLVKVFFLLFVCLFLWSVSVECAPERVMHNDLSETWNQKSQPHFKSSSAGMSMAGYVRDSRRISCTEKKRKEKIPRGLRFSPRKRDVLVFLLRLPFPLLLDNFVELFFVEF